MSVTASDLQAVRAHIDNIAGDDTPTYQNLGLLLALEAVFERAQAMPGPCDECGHYDANATSSGWGYCTNTDGAQYGRTMPPAGGCTKFEAEA